MRKAIYTTEGNEDTFIGYTDDSLPQSNIAMTKDEITKLLNASPYDYRFKGDTLTIYKGRGINIPSTPIPTDDLTILKGWFIDGFDLQEA